MNSCETEQILTPAVWLDNFNGLTTACIGSVAMINSIEKFDDANNDECIMENSDLPLETGPDLK